MEDTIEHVSFLARSEPRVRLLKEIYEQQVIEKNELRERVDASRTTVQRNLDALEERGWIEGDNRTYTITPSGQPVTEQLLRLLDTVYAARRLQPFLEFAPHEQFDLDFHRLATADITVADETDPYAPVNRHVALMEDADHFRCLLPAVGLQPMMVARTCVLEHGNRHEVILDPGVADTVRTVDVYRDVLVDLVSSDRARLLVSDDPVPFYLGLADDVVQIGVGDDEGTPRGLVESDASDVRRWANRTYSEYRDDATPMRTQLSNVRILKNDPD